MRELINDKLIEIDYHLDNIKELTPGMCDSAAVRILGAISNAEYSLREAHSYLVDPRDLNTGRARWET